MSFYKIEGLSKLAYPLPRFVQIDSPIRNTLVDSGVEYNTYSVSFRSAMLRCMSYCNVNSADFWSAQWPNTFDQGCSKYSK